MRNCFLKYVFLVLDADSVGLDFMECSVLIKVKINKMMTIAAKTVCKTVSNSITIEMSKIEGKWKASHIDTYKAIEIYHVTATVIHMNIF